VAISGETGFLVDPGDTGGLAAALSQLAGDATRRVQMGREGQRRFTDRFRHQTMTRQIRRLYEEVLTGKDVADEARGQA
jgi:glycosyltransferase involved in cell wall biosynthesis